MIKRMTLVSLLVCLALGTGYAWQIDVWDVKTLTAEDITATDDLVVIDDLTVTGLLAVTETATIGDRTTVNASVSVVNDTTSEVALNVKGVASQSSDLVIVEQSDGTDKLTVSAAGTTTAASLVATALTIGTRAVVFAQYAADPNAATATVTVTGLDADDYLLATLNTAPGNGATLDAAAYTSADTALLTFSADPAESVTVTVMSFQD